MTEWLNWTELNFYIDGETKKVWLVLLQYLFYCGGLELNLQYFLGMLVYAAIQRQRKHGKSEGLHIVQYGLHVIEDSNR